MMPDARSAISVAIPNWNGRRWLPGCLDALAAQTRTPAQVIVVDNGSADGSLGYLRDEHPPVEDVDLALRLRLAGWRCHYVPAVALHAGEGSSHQLAGGHHQLVERNTLLLVAKAFPLRWLPLVAYRQVAWAWHALRDHRLQFHL